jgi:trk system potassium uptake protein TrkH
MNGDFKRRMQRMRPGMLIIISYLSAALAGTALLSLPAASTSEPLAPVDALFTATSAICVTGLIVVDTGTQFTIFGKTVILILIQLGGLGVMTFSVFLFLFLGRGLGTKQRWIINESFTPTPIREIGSLIRSIFIFTFVIEGLGTASLFLFWREELPAAVAAFTSLFHAVSAFCNAGFSFFDTSFIAYKGSVLLNVTILALIVIGGIGFPVIYEVMGIIKRRQARERSRLSLHSRMVLWTTVVLIAAGGLLILLMEAGRQFHDLPWKERILTSLFQSITTRTAGFNTLDIPSLGETTLFVLIMLMFIGASPGSCGGGIKTTSLAVMVAVFRSKLRGRNTVDVFHRTLPDDTVSRALAIFIMGVLTVTVGLVLLLVTQMNTAQSGSAFFLAHLFEVVSAFATVGLSMGVTSTLTGAGKLVVVALMLLGRVGLLTVAYVVTRRARGSLFRYSEEKVMIG